jgi:outer membrane protein TolC
MKYKFILRGFLHMALLVFSCGWKFTAEKLNAQTLSDTIILNENAFLKNILEHHPETGISFLENQQAELLYLSRKGAFDPGLFGNFSNKYFDNKLYYRHASSEINLPIEFMGIDFHAGVQYSDGFYINPERILPDGGLAYAGVTIPLLQGMLIDDRRTRLRIARAEIEQTSSYTILQRNKILMDGAETYWYWFLSYLRYNTYVQALENSSLRLNAIRSSVQAGDKPAIDTLEAFIQVQQFNILLMQSLMNYEYNTRLLQNFIWKDDWTNKPLIVPIQGLNDLFIDRIRDQEIEEKHPLLRQIELELTINNMELRWQKEQLKPRLDLQYSKLIQTNSSFRGNDFNPLIDQTLGLKLSWPIYMRQARNIGKSLDLQSEKLELEKKFQETQIGNRVIAHKIKLKNLESQILDSRDNVSNFYRMLEAETDKFMAGESNVFMINAREQQWIQSQLALWDLQVMYKIVSLKILYEQGSLERYVLTR